MRISTPVRAAAAVAVVGLSLALAACDGDADAMRSPGAQPGGSVGSDTVPGDDRDGPEDADGDTDATERRAPTACLVGSWLADNERFGSLFVGAAAGTDAAGSVSDPTGSVVVTFGPAGEYRTTYRDWTLALTQDGMTIELVRDGTDEGGYSASDAGAIEWTEVSMGSVVTMTSPAGAMQVSSDPSRTSGSFVCAGDVLEITVDGSTSAFERRP